MGIALGRRPLVDEDLDSGRLIAPLDGSVASGFQYYVVCLPTKAGRRNIELFRRWLRASAHSYTAGRESTGSVKTSI